MTAAPLSCRLRSHRRPSSTRGPSASTLKSPAPRPAPECAARKTSRPHISLWRVRAARRAMPRRHPPRPTHRGCPARQRRGCGLSNGRRDSGVASTRSPVAPHTASHERAPAARTCMWGRVQHARRFRNASCEQPHAWLRGDGGKTARTAAQSAAQAAAEAAEAAAADELDEGIEAADAPIASRDETA